MKIRRLTICDWQGNRRNDTVIDNPSWTAIEAAIRAMNNANLNDVHLEIESSNDASLTIGGGSGKYIVSGTLAGESFPTLADPTATDGCIALVAGGQLGDYPARYVVNLEATLEAVRSVAESGSFDARLAAWTYI